jgi:hypothetical protein
MTVGAYPKIAGLTVVCAAVLAWAVLWRDHPSNYVVLCPDYDGPGIAHCWRVLPLWVWVVKWLVVVLAISASAVLITAYSPRAKILAATSAIALAAALAYIPYYLAVYQVLGEFHHPEPVELMPLAVCAAFGFCVAWTRCRWWPNTSFERTREG